MAENPDKTKRTPAEWQEKTGVKILDPDGWRIDGKSFDEPIDETEWFGRSCASTVEINWTDEDEIKLAEQKMAIAPDII